MIFGLKTGILGFALLVAGGCGAPDKPRTTMQPEYNWQTGKLVLLKYDTNADGHVDIWSYMDGARVVRIEIDKNADGKIERWEHYAPPGNTLIRIGFSRLNDGVEDAWTFNNPDGSVQRIEVSTNRDGRVNRTEFYQQNAMVRAVEDSDGDGKTDKWETFENGRLASVEVDTGRRGTPNRRVIYAPDGTARLEHLPAK